MQVPKCRNSAKLRLTLSDVGFNIERILLGIWILATLLAVPAGKFSYLKTIGHGTDVVFLVCYPYPAEFGNYYSKAKTSFNFIY